MIKCSCGGVVRLETSEERKERVERSWALTFPYSPPRHRKRRIEKKWRKRYDLDYEVRRRMGMGIGMLVSLSPVGNWLCDKCKRPHSGYQVMARSIIQVEPMPIGANSIYSGPGPEDQSSSED